MLKVQEGRGVAGQRNKACAKLCTERVHARVCRSIEQHVLPSESVSAGEVLHPGLEQQQLHPCARIISMIDHSRS